LGIGRSWRARTDFTGDLDSSCKGRQAVQQSSHAAQVFDAGRVRWRIVHAATGKARGSQDEIIELLAGPADRADARRMHQSWREARAVLDSQRLVSLDTILAVGEA